MTISNGHGDENKVRILNQYRLRPAMHTILLQGRSVMCCCGQPVTEEFYQFDAVDHAGNVVNLLYAGDDCAQTLLRLSETTGAATIRPLPLFNPLQPLNVDGYHEIEPGRRGNDVDVNPLNAELEQAIYLTLLCWEAIPRPSVVFSQLLDRIHQHPDRPLMDWEVRTVNTIICKSGHTLTAMLAELRTTNETLRHYTFPQLEAALGREAARTGLRIHNNF
jgi:hypothetical protein